MESLSIFSVADSSRERPRGVSQERIKGGANPSFNASQEQHDCLEHILHLGVVLIPVLLSFWIAEKVYASNFESEVCRYSCSPVSPSELQFWIVEIDILGFVVVCDDPVKV